MDWNVESRTEAQNRARKPKTLAFKRILGLEVNSRFLEVEETSPPLCNLLFSLKTPFLLVKGVAL